MADDLRGGHEEPGAEDAATPEIFAQCDWLSGRLDDIVQRVSQSATRRPLAGSRRRAWAAAFAARAAAERGQSDAAARLLALASATYDTRPDDVPGWSSWLPWAAGATAALAGDPAAGHELLDRAAGSFRAMDAGAYEAVVLVDAAEAAAAAGRADAAVTCSRRLAELTRTVEGEMVGPLAQLARAHALLATAGGAAAAAPAAEAADALDRLGCRLFGAMAAEVAGVAATDRTAAIETLGRAADGYDACGAVVRRGRVAKRLAGFGDRGRRAAIAGRDPALTPRELDVARLAAPATPRSRSADSFHRHPYGRDAPGSRLREARRRQQTRASPPRRGARPGARNSVARSVPSTDVTRAQRRRSFPSGREGGPP